MACIGWYDGEDWHEGEPSDYHDAELVRFDYIDDDGDRAFTTVAGPFPDFEDEADAADWFQQWFDENYG